MGNQSKTSKLTEGAMNTMKDAFNKDKDKTQGDKNGGRDVQKYTLALKNQEKSGYFATKDEGKLTMTMELVPATQYHKLYNDRAKSNPVGKGRSDPNHSPWCPPPVGRFEWSWNPITLFVTISSIFLVQIGWSQSQNQDLHFNLHIYLFQYIDHTTPCNIRRHYC